MTTYILVMFIRKRPTAQYCAVGTTLYRKICSADYVILINLFELAKISAPSPDSDYKVWIVLRILLRFNKSFFGYRVKLKLVTAKHNEQLDELRYLFLSLCISKNVMIYLHCQRSSVYGLSQIGLSKRFNN